MSPEFLEGADNIIGKGVKRQLWKNRSHGLIGDLLESAVDILNGIGLQTGISKQVELLQKINRNMKIYMHSQAHLIAAEGARHSKNNGNVYYSYGAPMSNGNVEKIFNTEANKNKADYVAHPLNIFKPSTWSKPGHGTENYGAAKAAREAKAAKGSK